MKLSNLSTERPQHEYRKPRRERNEQPGGFDSELQWWLNESQSIMGERGCSIEPSEAGRNTGTKGIFRAFRDLFAGDVIFGFGLGPGHGLIARANRCRQAWQLMPDDDRNIAMARYLFAIDPNEPELKGLHGAAGDLAGVVYLVAQRKKDPALALAKVIATRGAEAFEKAVDRKGSLVSQAAEACRVMHIAWRDCRIEVDRSRVPQ